MNQYENPSVGEVFLMPKAVTKHLCGASKSELCVLLYLFAQGGALDKKAAARALSLSETEVENALSFWRGAGIVTRKENKRKESEREEIEKEPTKTDASDSVAIVSETPFSRRTAVISTSELADAIEQNEDVRSLLSFASQKIGKILTPAEQTKIFALSDVLGMPFDLIMGVIEYCCSEDHKTVNYIERTAARMFEEDGITTFGAFEEYLSRKEKQKRYGREVRKIIGCGERAFTPSEEKILAKWEAEAVPNELLSAAYERTIKAIAKPSLAYMAKILERWKTQGIKTPKDLEDNRPFFSEKPAKIGKTEFRLEDFAEKPPAEDGAK